MTKANSNSKPVLTQRHGRGLRQIREAGEFGKEVGLVHEAIITGRKVGADRYFWATLAENEDVFKAVVRLVSNELINVFDERSPEKGTVRYGTIRAWSQVFGLARELIESRIKEAGVQPFTENLGYGIEPRMADTYSEDEIRRLCADLIKPTIKCDFPRVDAFGFIHIIKASLDQVGLKRRQQVVTNR